MAKIVILLSNCKRLRTSSIQEDAKAAVVFQFLKAFFLYYIWLLECIYCLTSVGVTIMTSSHKSALGLPTKLAPYRSDTVYPAMIATTLSQYEYVLICDKSNIRVSGSPHYPHPGIN
ncbi:hypothetical protein PHYBLDRAFT_63348 [Phycomyces blakesleeanus NRRL 1555(-)]|uniref:Uncharacterized protein n=1 Tax=Phycomyces blakesleeanus (strain ATCC 8743b / DSM 1359 / FGSC 10004 / NBRC 33097 / NRRL 1555) TaxID=763407 RepID=A0A167KS09_PHYB8|nr:hypothetical protein PHYBLDRAFT_63348 [Phycomyces blakesleeanus NRRL 1555(-)]OAD68747.1 hypothetical protein PHYBLDRAFT_63348 [Phycomyces blakesleeanus NRRL 1555(-)]|eukprot:XP_018286787.1 hypothetical protein PHYBLDRAFT_63348 [Phycomyces blakesleeanus NRRL 1555(-)]